MWATTTPTTSPALLTVQGPCRALGLLSPITGTLPLGWPRRLSHPKGSISLILWLAGSPPNIRCGSMTDEEMKQLRTIKLDLVVLALNVRAASEMIGQLIGEPYGNREEPHG